MNNKFNKILISKRTNYSIVSMENFKSENDFLNDIAEKIHNGVDIIEFRGNNLTSNKFLTLALKVRELTAVFNALLIIYERIDIAKLANADGITLDENTINIEQAQKLLENNMLVGFNCKNQNEAQIAQHKNIDFIVSKENYNNLIIKNYKINL